MASVKKDKSASIDPTVLSPTSAKWSKPHPPHGARFIEMERFHRPYCVISMCKRTTYHLRGKKI